MSRGDVVWLELAGGRGHAQAGRRPAVVVQSDLVTEVVPTLVVVPLTSNLEALRYPSTMVIAATSLNGLKRDSVALTFQLTTVDRAVVTETVGTVSPEVMAGLCQAISELVSGVEPTDESVA